MEQGGVGSDIGHYFQPRQLAVSISGYVYVSDYCNHRIKILDGDLRYVRHISHESMTSPCDVKLTPDKVYVLSAALCIHVFSHEGEKIQSLILCEFSPRFDESTPFFCLDIKDNFVISDCSLCQIQIFSREGKLIYRLGFQELQFEIHCFYFPSGVAQTANGKLLVALQMGQKMLRMFSL